MVNEVIDEQETEAEKKPYLCDGCGKRFVNAGGLALHKANKNCGNPTTNKKQRAKDHEKRMETLKEADDEIELKENITKKKKTILIKQSDRLDAETLAIAQMLINTGTANSLSELKKKGIYALAYNSGIKNKEEDEMETSNPSKLIKQLQEAQVSKKILDQWGGENIDGGDMNMNDMLKTMKKQYEFKMMKNLMEGDGVNMPQMMSQMMMMKMMGGESMGGGSNQPNPEVEALKLQMEQMRRESEQMRRESETKRWEDLMKMMMDGKGKDEGSLKDYFMALEGIRGDRDVQIKQMENQLHEQKMNTLINNTENVRNELKRDIEKLSGKNLGGFSDRIREAVETKVLEKLDVGEMIGQPKEDRWDKIQKVFGTVIENIKEPILTPIGQALAHNMIKPKVQRPTIPPNVVEEVQSPMTEQQEKEKAMQQEPIYEDPFDEEGYDPMDSQISPEIHLGVEPSQND